MSIRTYEKRSLITVDENGPLLETPVLTPQLVGMIWGLTDPLVDIRPSRIAPHTPLLALNGISSPEPFTQEPLYNLQNELAGGVFDCSEQVRAEQLTPVITS